jgi:hypothetical protein
MLRHLINISGELLAPSRSEPILAKDNRANDRRDGRSRRRADQEAVQSAVLCWREKPEGVPAVEAIPKKQDCSWGKLTLIVSNQLSSDPVEHGKPASHSDARGQHRHLHELLRE